MMIVTKIAALMLYAGLLLFAYIMLALFGKASRLAGGNGETFVQVVDGVRLSLPLSWLGLFGIFVDSYGTVKYWAWIVMFAIPPLFFVTIYTLHLIAL